MFPLIGVYQCLSVIYSLLLISWLVYILYYLKLSFAFLLVACYLLLKAVSLIISFISYRDYSMNGLDSKLTFTAVALQYVTESSTVMVLSGVSYCWEEALPSHLRIDSPLSRPNPRLVTLVALALLLLSFFYSNCSSSSKTEISTCQVLGT